jgi:hypothetical protein
MCKTGAPVWKLQHDFEYGDHSYGKAFLQGEHMISGTNFALTLQESSICTYVALTALFTPDPVLRSRLCYRFEHYITE